MACIAASCIGDLIIAAWFRRLSCMGVDLHLGEVRSHFGSGKSTDAEGIALGGYYHLGLFRG